MVDHGERRLAIMINSSHAFNVTLLQANAHSREDQIVLRDWSIFFDDILPNGMLFRIHHQNLPIPQRWYREIH
jgi:hypothetical protein